MRLLWVISTKKIMWFSKTHNAVASCSRENKQFENPLLMPFLSYSHKSIVINTSRLAVARSICRVRHPKTEELENCGPSDSVGIATGCGLDGPGI
jgi:hypothetical protein